MGDCNGFRGGVPPFLRAVRSPRSRRCAAFSSQVRDHRSADGAMARRGSWNRLTRDFQFLDFMVYFNPREHHETS
jgi:hypothetical protein